MADSININGEGRIVGSKYPTYIIAEMSANHGGDFNKAIEIIHKAKAAGADCIKIQTYTADTLTIDSNKSFFQITEGTWKGENLYQLYKKAFTPWEWQADLKKEAENIGIDFLSTPFDKTAVDFLEKINISAYKISSFELIDLPLIKYVASKKKPIILSTGMASIGEIDEAVRAIRSENNNQICLLKCTSAYPAKPVDMNLSTIPHLQKTFNSVVGLSDHSLGSLISVAAVCLGARIIEKHFCLDRKIKTPDSNFSMEPNEFKKMVEDIRTVEKSLGKISYHGVPNEKSTKIHRKSIFVIQDMKKGDFFNSENIRIIRPAQGLAPKYYSEIIGKKAIIDVEKGTPLNWNMLF